VARPFEVDAATLGKLQRKCIEALDQANGVGFRTISRHDGQRPSY
jgi:hypothetical protein